jgi:hypothetical protein
MSDAIESTLQEQRVFPPAAGVDRAAGKVLGEDGRGAGLV